MPTVSVILPCLNEAESIGDALRTVSSVFTTHALDGEIIVVDNGSTDGSTGIIKHSAARYIYEPRRGYGNAYRAGFREVQGNIVIMADPDNSYDLTEIPNFLTALTDCDAVLGSRFRGTMEPGAMPFLHRYIGNPGLRLLFFLLYGIRLSEPSTGFLAIRREHLPLLKLREPGMEFSSEMLVRIHRCGLKMKEIPIDYHRRAGTSKLRTFRDGFRHLSFLLKERLRSV